MLLRLHFKIALPLSNQLQLIVHIVAVLTRAEFCTFISTPETLAVLFLALSLLTVAAFVFLFDVFTYSLPSNL
jgi:hypothetical protein